MTMNLNEIIERKVSIFKKRLSDKSTSEKKLFHHRSVLNISKRIVLYQDQKTNLLKEKLIDYFEKLEKSDFFIDDKLTSTKLHKYLLPIIQYLIRKEQFVTNGDLHLITIMGAVIDGVLYFIIPGYYYPVFIALFFILGIYRRREAKKNGKYAAMFW